MKLRRRGARAVRDRWVVCSILLASAILMVWGVWTVRPTVMLPDEAGALEQALKMGINRSPFVDGFRKGGNFHLHILTVAFVPYVLYLVATGRLAAVIDGATEVSATGINPWQGPAAFVAALYDFLIISRLVSVVAGVLTVYVVYRLGTRLYDRRAGLFAGAFLTASMLFVNVAHFGTEDAPMAFFIAATILFVIRYRQSHRRRELAGAAFVAGLAVSTKATAAVLIVPLVWAFRHRVDRDLGIGVTSVDGVRYLLKEGALYASLGVLGYVLTTPSVLLYPGTWWNDVVFEAEARSTIYAPEEPGWLVHLGNLANGLGLPLFVLSVAGLTYVLWQTARSRDADSALIYPLSFLVTTYLLVGSWETTGIWYVAPIVPFLAVFTGGLVSNGLADDRTRTGTFVVALVVLVFSLGYTGLAAQQFATDSRVQATEWLDENVEDDAVIDTHATHHYLPAFPEAATLERIPVYSFTNESDRQRAHHRVDCRIPDYVVLSRFHYGRYLRTPDAFPEETAFFSALLSEEQGYETAATFGPITDPDESTVRAFGNSLTPQVYAANPRIVILKRTGSVDPSCDRDSSA
jgi:hypothetical protein